MPKHFEQGRDPISSYTHYIGALLSFIGTVAMVLLWFINGSKNIVTLISILVFGASMMALYNASAYYHFVKTTPARLLRLRKLDHAMIYVLIAGTYTPIALTFMQRTHGIIFTSVIWAIAISGIVIKVLWFNAPRWLYTSLYLLLGWAIVFDFKAFSGIPIGCITLVALGGISYSVGAVMYILKKPNFSKSFGFHEVFHLFIMLGTLFHFIAVFFYVL